MAAWSELGGGMKAAVVLAGVAGIGIGGFWLLGPRHAPPAENAPAAIRAPDPAAAPEPAAAPMLAPAAVPEPEASTPPEAPSVGTWRVAPDGAAVVAGRAPPGAVVVIAVDGAEAAQAPVSAGGDFAVLFTLAPKPAPSLMTLEARLADGSALAFAQSIALAPIVGAIPPTGGAPDSGPDKTGPDKTGPDSASDTLPAALAGAAGAVGVLITDAGVEVQPATPSQPLAKADLPAADLPEDALPAAPETAMAAPPVQVTIDAISYDPAGHVILSGQGAAEHVVRAYLDNNFAIEGPTGRNGRWNLTLPDGAPGVYTLRVDLLASDGKVVARYETPFKRESPEALAALTTPPPPTPVAPVAPVAEVPVAEVPAESPPAEAPPTRAPADESVPAVVASAPAEPAAPAAPAGAPATPAPLAAPETPAQPGPEAAPAAPPQMVSITVQPGYSLWKIARDTYGEGVLYVQVFEANRERIRDPDLIYPGQVFLLPAQ